MLAFLFSDPAVEVLKLAWEPQSSSEPEDSSKKGTLLICVAFWKTDLYGQHVRGRVSPGQSLLSKETEQSMQALHTALPTTVPRATHFLPF